MRKGLLQDSNQDSCVNTRWLVGIFRQRDRNDCEEIEKHYWHAGRSGKNTDLARAAGVVGTFGIGAIANFGVADELQVESESAVTGERTRSSVLKSELSTESDGISVQSVEPTGNPGTIVKIRLANDVTLRPEDATHFLSEFVEFLSVPVC